MSQDEAASRAASLEREVGELREGQQRAEDRLREVTRTLAELEERKRRADDKLNKSTAALGQNVSIAPAVLVDHLLSQRSKWRTIIILYSER